MTTHAKRFTVIELPGLVWPPTLVVPSKRFRLLVAADTTSLSTDVLSDFALAALEHGMVYFCSWGSGCERFHDIVDEVVVDNDPGPQPFSGLTRSDVIMTTWHEAETLETALDFLVSSAVPTEGFEPGSDFRLVISVGNPNWTAIANKFFESA